MQSGTLEISWSEENFKSKRRLLVLVRTVIPRIANAIQPFCFRIAGQLFFLAALGRERAPLQGTQRGDRRSNRRYKSFLQIKSFSRCFRRAFHQSLQFRNLLFQFPHPLRHLRQTLHCHPLPFLRLVRLRKPVDEKATAG